MYNLHVRLSKIVFISDWRGPAAYTSHNTVGRSMQPRAFAKNVQLQALCRVKSQILEFAYNTILCFIHVLDQKVRLKFSLSFCRGCVLYWRQSTRSIGAKFFCLMTICVTWMVWRQQENPYRGLHLGTKHGCPYEKLLTVSTSGTIRIKRARKSMIRKL